MARVILARIGAPHGVRGEVRLKSYAEDPQDVAAYGPLEAPDGRRFTIQALRPAAGKATDMLVVRLEGVADRDAAAALTGVELSVDRDRLPPADDDEFYHADLIGLAAVTLDGARLGRIVAVANYGAGDLLEIAPDRGPVALVPFTKDVVPTVDLAGGRVVVDPPAGAFDPPGVREAGEASAGKDVGEPEAP